MVTRGFFSANFLRIVKDRRGDPSEIRAPDFKGEFWRSTICSVSATIDIDRLIFKNRRQSGVIGMVAKRPSAILEGCSVEPAAQVCHHCGMSVGPC